MKQLSFFILCLVILTLYAGVQSVQSQQNDLLWSEIESAEKNNDFEKGISLLYNYHQEYKPTADSWLTLYRLWVKKGNQHDKQAHFLVESAEKAYNAFEKATQLVASNRAMNDFVLQEKSIFAQWLYDKSVVLMKLGDLTSSLRLSKWSLSLTPTRLDALELVLFGLSKLSYYSDEFESYGQLYLNQTVHEPKRSIIELNLDYFTTHTNFQSGEVWAEIALKTIYREPNESLSKKLIHFHISGGNFALEKNDVDQAAFHYQKVIELTDDEWFRITLAKLYTTQELFQQAEYELNRVFLAEIESLDVLEYYASVHRMISTETKRSLTEPINWVVNPRFTDHKWLLQGKLELSRNNVEKAILHFQHFIDLHPNHAEALELQGRTYLQLAADLQSNEHYAKAMTFLKTSLLHKSNNDALRKLIEELEREDN